MGRIGVFSSFFEIGGQVVELDNEYQYYTGKRPAKVYKERKKVASDLKKTSKHMSKMETRTDSDSGTFQTLGHYIGFGIGLGVSAASFPAVMVDSPLPGPADAAWFLFAVKTTQSTTTLGERVGEVIDDYIA